MTESSEIRRRYRSSDLFLVRFWADDKSDGTTGTKCRGKVQRVMDGESHEFGNVQDLIDLLLAMLKSNERR